VEEDSFMKIFKTEFVCNLKSRKASVFETGAFFDTFLLLLTFNKN